LVSLLKEQSGFAWDELKGATITVESEPVWRAYVLKYPKASPFRNKGWPHYDDMMPLMPTMAKGLNVFHASQAVPDSGPSDNAGDGESGGVNADEEWENNADAMPNGMDENRLSTPPPGLPVLENKANEEHIPWSQTPPPLTRSQSPYLGPSINQKRRHSAISSGTTLATTSIQKRARRDVTSSSAGALQGLTAELNSFSDTFLEGIALAAPTSSTLAPLPLRKTRAITCADTNFSVRCECSRCVYGD
ncbi:hypothetical protein F5888DRAFT_1617695, partial [Russula emetica]